MWGARPGLEGAVNGGGPKGWHCGALELGKEGLIGLMPTPRGRCSESPDLELSALYLSDGLWEWGTGGRGAERLQVLVVSGGGRFREREGGGVAACGGTG